MNKSILALFTILCLLSTSFLIGYKLSAKAGSTTCVVDKDGTEDFKTIQEAINNAASGDTIIVHRGTYYEHIIINKTVSLVGEDRDLTIIDGNGTDTVISVRANNVRIEGFTMKRGGTGIFIDHSRDNYISHNIMTNNYYGISLYSSINNVISDNTVSSNNYYGIIFFDSINNMVFHNNFINNTKQAYTRNSISIWDNGFEGNYWSNYTGFDSNHNGIGDTSHIIDAKNQDNHPLMGMFSAFSLTSEGETHHVTIICNSTISKFRFEIGNETGNKKIRFTATGENNTVGFCRVAIPTELMNCPYIVLVDVEEIVSTLLDVSNKTYSYLYFTYIHSSHTITIISSKALYLYNKLQIDLYNLNMTYYDLLNNYSILLDNYSQLQESYRELNSSYQEHLLDYSENVHDIQNLIYIFAATTAIFIITTIYLSKSAHAGKTMYSNIKK